MPRLTTERVLPDNDLLVVTAELTTHFSVTGSAWYGRGKLTGTQRHRRHYDPDASGMLHTEILAAIPALAPVIAVHLADPLGMPMHAFANGWYFYSGQCSAWERAHPVHPSNREELTDHQRGARALHIAEAELPEGMDREQFMAFAETLRPRWLEMALAALAVIEGTVSL